MLRDLFRPKWRHSNPEVRLAALTDSLDRRNLTWIVLNDQNAAVRSKAAHLLFSAAPDADLISWVARTCQDSEVAAQALVQVPSRSVQKEIVLGWIDDSVKPSQAPGLSLRRDPVTMLKHVTDQELLSEIVMEARDFCVVDVDRTEVPRDTGYFTESLTYGKPWCAAALDRIVDESILAELAERYVDNKFVAFDAFADQIAARVTSQTCLESIARRGKSVRARRNVVDRVTSQEVLQELALEDSDQWVRVKAARRVTDEDVARAIAERTADRDVLVIAIEKLDRAQGAAVGSRKQRMLLDFALARQDFRPGAEELFVWNLITQETLAQEACGVPVAAPKDDVIRLVIPRIKAASWLEHVAANAKSARVRLEAAVRMGDRSYLSSVLQQSPPSLLWADAARYLRQFDAAELLRWQQSKDAFWDHLRQEVPCSNKWLSHARLNEEGGPSQPDCDSALVGSIVEFYCHFKRTLAPSPAQRELHGSDCLVEVGLSDGRIQFWVYAMDLSHWKDIRQFEYVLFAARIAAVWRVGRSDTFMVTLQHAIPLEPSVPV